MLYVKYILLYLPLPIFRGWAATSLAARALHVTKNDETNKSVNMTCNVKEKPKCYNDVKCV